MHRTQNLDTTAPLAGLTPADILRCAARYLQTHGWIQGNYHAPDTADPFPPACALGAINMAAYGRRTISPVRTEADKAACRLVNRASVHLADWLWNAGSVKEHNYYGAMCCSDTEIVTDWNDEEGQDLAAVTDALTTAADDYDRTHTTGGTR